MEDKNSKEDSKSKSFPSPFAVPQLFQLRNVDPKELNFNFGDRKSKPVFFCGEPTSKALMKKVEELATKIDQIDDKLNNMNSLLSSVLNRATSSEQNKMPQLDTISSKSTDNAPAIPKKLWEQIFLHLETYDLLQVRLTCRSWKHLVDSSSALRECFLFSFPEDVIMDREYLPTDLPPAAHVTFRKVRIISVSGWWSSFGGTLVQLGLYDCKLLLSTLLDLLRQTPKLKCLTLKGLKYPEDGFQSANFWLEDMEQLTLEDTDVDDIFGSIFPRLKEFRYLISVPAKPENAPKLIRFMAVVQNTLQKIELWYHNDIINSLTTLINLKLKRLTFYTHNPHERYDAITNLIELCRRQPTIEQLLLPLEIKEVTSEHLAQIGKHLRQLQLLSVTTATNNSAFLKAMTGLKSLVWCCATNIDFTGCGNPNLQHLHLKCMRFQNNNLFHYLNKSPKLSSLTLENCAFNSWESIFELVKRRKTLYRLELVSLQVAQKNEALLEYFDNLQILRLCNLPMSKAMLIILFRLCPQLEQLELCQMAHADDEVVELVCQKLRKLKRLTLDRCPVTDVTAIELYRAQLEYLYIDRCDKNAGHQCDQWYGQQFICCR